MEERKPLQVGNSFFIANIYEQIVKESVLDMMQHMDMCKCDKCTADAIAMVLNKLPPHYVTTRKGELLSQLPEMKMENQVEMTVKVVQVLRMVRESPRH